MTILRNLGYGKNRLQEIITEESEEMCRIIISKEGENLDICALLKYDDILISISKKYWVIL